MKMHHYISWIGFIALINCTNAVPLSDFIPFGRSEKDWQFSGYYRAASSVISITPRFPYFNETYSVIYVSSHGYVTFSGQTAFINPVNFPFRHPLLSVICPFWANLDQTASGTTYYRNVSSSSHIDNEIRRYFSYAKDFTTKWALIATWEKVGYYRSHGDKVNTFQVAVATNGSQSYAIFHYLDNGIQWSSADNTGGVNGIGPFGAQVGFNGGDGVHFFVRPETQSDSILELDDNSNVCVPGLYVFRIDGDTVQPGRCVNIKQDMCSKDIGKDTSPILIVSNQSSIITVNLDTNVVDQYGVDGYIIYGISFDLVNRMIYWSEIALGVIRRVSFDDHLNGSAVETIVTGLSTPEQLAVDWVNRKLYWTDHRRGVIERSDLDGSNIEVIVNIEVRPQAIVVDPFHEMIYWINYYTVPRTIERLSTNDLIKHTILNVANPSGLTIDYDKNLLYWTDDQFNQLLSSDLTGNNIKVVPVSAVITEPYAITVFQSKLYWTDQYPHINIVNQFTGVSQGSISASLNRPTGIHVIDYSRQPGVLRPFIIKDTFLHCITVLAPESFTMSVEFVAVCMNFNVTWEFKGNQYVGGLTNLSNSRYKASLTIIQSSEEDSGTYTLTVTSAAGSDSVKIVVKIINYCTPSTIQDAYLLFTDYNSVNRINLDGTNKQVVVSNLYNIHGMDFDILTNMVYWCEVNEGKIYRASINCYGKELIVSGLVNPEEVAIDWINRKLYWCDFGHDVIVYSNLDGTSRRLLVNLDLDQPRGLMIDPFFGHIYWTDWGASPKIEKMTLSGRNRHAIVAFNLLWPNCLTIDYATRKLYWVDAAYDTVETSDLEGAGRTILFRSPHPFGITVFNGILFWTDWTNNSIVSADIDGSTTNNVTNGLLRPSNIHIVHYSVQPGAWYPYIIKDTFIEYVIVQAPECFTLSVEFISCCNNFTVTWQFNESYIVSTDKYMINTTAVKHCHYKTSLTVLLSSDADTGNYTITVTSATGSDRATISVNIIRECIPFTIEDPYLLFTDYNTIKRINLDGTNQSTVVSNVFNVHGMDFDILTNMVYWCEVSEGDIYRASIGYDGRQLIVSGLVHPEEVAIDWINRKLYWCDFGTDTIEYSKLDGTNRKLLLNTNVDKPRGLAIDPFSGHIYWTDWGDFPKIEKMTLTGGDRRIIVGTGLRWPSGLTIDFTTLKLYWVDASLGKVEMSDLDGRGRQVLYSGGSVPHPFGIAVYKRKLYLTDWSYRAVTSGSIDGSTTLRNLTYGIRPSNIHVVHHSVQPGACGVNCSCLSNEPYIFVSNGTSIEKRTLIGSNGSTWTTLVDASTQPLGIDIDSVTCKLFWSTGSRTPTDRKGEIKAVSLIDGSSATIHSGLGYPVQIAVNWITRKIYWSDTTLLTIEYSDLDGANRKILLSNVVRVVAIALDPRVNVIYWVSKEHDFVISKMKLCGTSKRVIVSSNLDSPNSLAIDFTFNRLYWTDGSKIKTSDLEGGDISTVFTTESRRPTGLSVYDNVLFWAEWKFERISTCSTDGTDLDTLIDNVKKAAAIRVLHKSVQPRSCYDTYDSQGAK